MTGWAYINNDFVPAEKASISFRDLSFQRGYGIFDFLRVHENLPLFMEDHLERFFASAGAMHLAVPKSKTDIARLIEQLVQRNQLPQSGVRLGLTGGESPDGYNIGTPTFVLSQHLFTPVTTDQLHKGIRLLTHEHRRQLPHVKTIDYLMAIWLQPRLRESGADDVLYHFNGVITECPRANFFVVTKNNTLLTTPSGILSGITRKRVLQLASEHVKTEERPVTLNDIREAREAFITSTTKGILPVAQIDDVHYKSPFTTSLKLHALLSERIQRYLSAAAE
jgi:D-alanine transaminase/branched-chain amino acid aminotransferase